jgi:hypothetical protein
MKQWVGLIALLAFTAGQAWAYEVVTVTGGGTVKGKISYKGPAPKDETLKIDEDQKVCGTEQKAEKYLLSPRGEVRNALVVVEGVTKGKAVPKQETTIDNKKCRFEPLVSIAYKDASFAIKNSDPIFHNTNLGLKVGEKRRTLYNLALPTQGQVIKKPAKTTGFVPIKCDAHAWMRAYVAVVDHPYAAVTDKEGSFELKDLLPGKYTLWIWHEGFGELKKPFEVTAGKTTELTIEFKK